MPQDPAVIQQQIEETRAELAETIDSITEIVSPRRVAERAQMQLRVKTAELRHRYGPALGIGPGPALPELEAGVGADGVDRRGDAGTLTGGALDGRAVPGPSGGATVVRVVRWERVVLVGGGVLLLVGGIRHRRRRRSSRRG
ncbi:hypothetical protein CcI156_12465 [Frankia sp. CcI156]|uniref:DUF3618 domain-containing protein n=1 Tax=Frankia casuarinae (strain DSM 45818 / CECT 9043 / HFP020203 / CcI3) TaxID=106370 RepID=Q2JEJ2_FRACC|nr:MULTISPECIES: DUF3618 domain-containing protein [Frankia]ABD10300.1 hypothetical protein Francci3_0916 [Frankia casuarinae]ETA01944.1 hypothetical protein CcI6DRAFT_02629 [Frankia sp. CcI6]EYT92609.1 hypothetical protein ThrDRAFT_01728 [Frankia casuarinae]KDA43387.1 hypothetical protein BMG523Draft_01704 [Frankia sp. BMG5.23]OAA24635.1 Protein of unknown function (DUF3618) [Frankia casuarinae]